MASKPWGCGPLYSKGLALFTALFSIGLVAPAVAASDRGPRPNFVVVLVDDMRWDSLEAAGHSFLRNPHIDRLSKEGVRFENAFVTTPLCSPSRASFLAGQYARVHGVTTNDDSSELSYRLVTYPALLEKTGYDTAFIGKWHMGEDDAPRPGFTHWVAFAGQGIYLNPTLNINGARQKVEGYATDVLSYYAVDFVRTAAHGSRPFLLLLSHKAVHEPYVPPPRHEDIYASETVRCSPGCGDPLSGKLALTRNVPGVAKPLPGGGPSDDDIRTQLSLLSAVDDGLGGILEALQEEGILENTVIVFTSDNGFFHREHGLNDKRWGYEEAIRIPLLFRYAPFGRRGETLDELVLNIDLAPTILDLAEVPVPDGVQGRSLVPLLMGEPSDWRDAFAAEYFEEAPFPLIPSWEALRTTQFKYIRYPALGDPYDELYDLVADPFEIRNLAANPELAATRERLRSELDRLLISGPH